MQTKDTRKWRVMVCKNTTCNPVGLSRKHWHEFDGKVHLFTCDRCGKIITIKHGDAVKRYEKTRIGREKNRLTSVLPRESFL